MAEGSGFGRDAPAVTCHAGSRRSASPTAGHGASPPLSSATPDRAGARPYHGPWRIASLIECHAGSRRSASLPRAMAHRLPYRVPRRIAQERVPTAGDGRSPPLSDVFQPQMTLSLPPSIGTCAPVVLEKHGPHNSAMSSPTSRLVISVLRILFVLYSWTEIP